VRTLANESDLWIDLHAHLFNTSDVPVREFIAHAAHRTEHPKWDAAIGWFLAYLGRRAPSYEAERVAIERAIGRRTLVAPPAHNPPKGRDWFWRIAWRYTRLLSEARRPRLVQLDDVDKITNTEKPKRPIDLFVTLGVDMECGVKGVARTPPEKQFDLTELLSEATIRGFDGCPHGVVMPMIGFDPRRHEGHPNSLDRVKARVESGSAIGVKLYPPMGFRPLGNTPEIDAQLHDLYDWATRFDVPITAHCSPANAVAGAENDARPGGWRPVLEHYEGLRLNLAHVGGIEKSDPSIPEQRKGWAEEAMDLIAEFHGKSLIFADVSNHDHGRGKVHDFVKDLADKTAPGTGREAVRGRLAFGTDFWFVFMHDAPAKFLHRYVDEIVTHFGTDALSRFAGGAAQEFLGFDLPQRQNRLRVLNWLCHLQTTPPGAFSIRPSLRRVLSLSPQEAAEIEAHGTANDGEHT
jgi:hypothetical protein